MLKVPDVDKMSSLNINDLCKLRPTSLHWNKSFTVFGISMNDGQLAVGGTGKYDRSAPIPANLTKVEVFFMKGEHLMHSMRFIGDTEITIGNVDKFRTPANERKGRMEEFIVGPGEEMLGCELDCDDFCTFGVTWITWKPPSPEEMSKILLGRPL